MAQSTVKLDFKNRQDKNQLGFKNQIANDQVDQISFKDRQDKNNLTLRIKMTVTKNVFKVKFDCTCNPNLFPHQYGHTGCNNLQELQFDQQMLEINHSK